MCCILDICYLNASIKYWNAGKSKERPKMGSDAASDCQMASVRPSLSPLFSGPLQRYYLRQEPGALAPLADICAGGVR
jgi:hypothetical protein